MSVVDRYLGHGEWTDPGEHRAAVAALGDDLPSLLEAVRGLLVHGDYLDLYDLSAAEFSGHSRDTMSVAARLTQILSRDASPLSNARPPAGRAVATCRDYALLLCAFLREKGIAARVRCGFARYFAQGRFEDHWVCEYWNEAADRWHFADAQLDAETRRHLGIDFDTSALPDGWFLTSDKAWQLWRSGMHIGGDFGHGAVDGAWFLAVNLARDLLALHMREVSGWDGWRNAPPELRKRHPGRLEPLDAIADHIVQVDMRPGALADLPEALQPDLKPFWLARPT